MKSEHAGPDDADADRGADGERPSSDDGARLSDWLVGRLRPSGIEGLAPPPSPNANSETGEPPGVPPGDQSDDDEELLPVAGLPSRPRRWVLLAALVGAVVIALFLWRTLSSRPLPARAGAERNDAPPAGVGDDLPRPPPAGEPEQPLGQASSTEKPTPHQRGEGEPVEAPGDPAGPHGPSIARFPDLPPHVLKTLETPADDED